MSAVRETGPQRLEGLVAIVTGAAGGLGAASARRLASEGARVVAVDIDDGAAARLAQDIGGDAIPVTADVGTEAGVESYMTAARATFGRVDLHHLNAGISGSFDALPDMSVADFDQVMTTNATGVFLGLRAAFRQYREQPQGAHAAIAITASIASLRAAADLVAYHTSKHAVLGLMRTAAVYGAPLGVRVNAVAPGIVPTPLFASAGARQIGGASDMERRATTTPLRRAGRPEEIAAVVAFLLSDDASYMVGEVVSVDGGASVVNTCRPAGGAGLWDPATIDPALRAEGAPGR
jgi:NAD(P)-dependent dehydrogenase (short-subunit alcohol dehydrogenase family)